MPDKNNQRDRYRTHHLYSNIGINGQERITKSTVCIVGIGALGSRCAELLARSGTGTLRLIDDDTIELSNLPRQTMYTEDDVGQSKVQMAKRHIALINSEVSVEGVEQRVIKSNAAKLCSGCDLIIDGTDNMPSRYVLNDYAAQADIPFVHGAVLGGTGFAGILFPKEGPCLRCIRPKAPQNGKTADTAGIINTLPSIVASMQATLAIRYMADNRRETKMLHIDSWNMVFNEITLKRRADCVCSAKKVNL